MTSKQAVPFGVRPEDRRLCLMMVLAAMVARTILASMTGYTADDAFITFRHAANFLAGGGFSFNPHEAVLGTSSPLYGLLLVVPGWLFGVGAIPVASLVFGIAAEMVSCVLLFGVLEELATVPRRIVVGLFALYPKAVFIATLGMEAPLVVMLMLLSLRLVQRGSFDAAAIVSALLLLLRLDAIAWCVVLWVALFRSVSRFPVWGAAAGVILLSTGALLATWVYGSPIPVPVVAKHISWGHLFPTFDPVRALAGLLPFHRMTSAGDFWKTAAAGFVIVSVAGAAWLLRRRENSLHVFPWFFLVYLGAFAAGKTIMHDWYYAPAFLALFVSLGVLFDLSWGGVFRHASFLPVSVVVVCAGVLYPAGISWSKDPGLWFRSEIVRVAQLLKGHGHDGESALLEPIGFAGWTSGLYIHDSIGLVSPLVLEYRRRFPGSDRWYMAYVRDQAPTFLVLQKEELRNNALFLGFGGPLFASSEERAWFDTTYAPIQTAGEAPSKEHVFSVYRHR